MKFSRQVSIHLGNLFCIDAGILLDVLDSSAKHRAINERIATMMPDVK